MGSCAAVLLALLAAASAQAAAPLLLSDGVPRRPAEILAEPY